MDFDTLNSQTHHPPHTFNDEFISSASAPFSQTLTDADTLAPAVSLMETEAVFQEEMPEEHSPNTKFTKSLLALGPLTLVGTLFITLVFVSHIQPRTAEVLPVIGNEINDGHTYAYKNKTNTDGTYDLYYQGKLTALSDHAENMQLDLLLSKSNTTISFTLPSHMLSGQLIKPEGDKVVIIRTKLDSNDQLLEWEIIR